MENLDLIVTLTGCLAAALVCGYITLRLGLSPIVGYLLAGVVVGPTTPGFVADRHLAEQFAEVGVILLMFGVGLQFHVEELLAVRKVALPGALGQSLVATGLGTLLGVACGWGWSAGIVFGLAISVASTVVLMRVLEDHGDLHTPTGHLAVGWLVVEDLFTVLVLVLLPALFGRGGAGAGQAAVSVGLAVVKVGAMVLLTFLLGERLFPRILDRVARTRSRELFVLTVLVLALGVAVGSAKLFGVSMALGAFLAGMVVGRSEFSLRAATEALPMRDAFAVLFFVSVGILFNPRSLLSLSGPHRGHALHRPGRQAPRRAGDRAALQASPPGRHRRRRRPRADRRVLVHPGVGRQESRHPRRECDQHARRRGNHLHFAQPPLLPVDRSSRTLAPGDHQDATA